MSKVSGVLKSQDKKIALMRAFYELCNSAYIGSFSLCKWAHMHMCVCVCVHRCPDYTEIITQYEEKVER